MTVGKINQLNNSGSSDEKRFIKNPDPIIEGLIKRVEALEKKYVDEQKKLWMCIKNSHNYFDFIGVFSTEENAIDACYDEYCFIAPSIIDYAHLNKEEIGKWRGLYYPLKK
ncbi:MAG: hypothetical protein V3U78_04530 [Thiotrichaceae bacterium]